MKMKIFIPIMMLLFCMGLAMAATVVNLDPQGNLANGTYQTSSSISYGINVTGNQTSWNCYLYTNENGSSGSGDYEVKVTGASVANNTNYAFPTRTLVADAAGTTAYNWSVKCNATTDGTGAWSGGNSTLGTMTYGVDANAPIMTVLYPTANKVWYTDDSAVRMGLHVNDTNAASCVLQTNLDTTNDNTTVYNNAFQIATYTTDTNFNFSGINSSQDFADSGVTLYSYSYKCNDSAGNEVTLGSNYTFFIDTTAPSAFDWNSSLFKTNNVALWNATTATDYTPQVGWNITTEANFSKYRITFYNGSFGGTYNATLGDRRIDVTSISTLSTNISELLADEDYYILVTAYDVAGNAVNTTTTDYKYTTTSTNRALKAGWNIVGNVGNAFTLSSILNWSGATTASYWNSTHEFQSHVSGGSFSTVSIAAGEPVLIYMGADANFGDLVLNTTAVASNTAKAVTNSSSSSDNSNWNLVMQKATTAVDLQSIDNYCNCESVGVGCSSGANNATNVDYISFYNNSASSGAKYISYVANWSINNATSIKFGETAWMYIDQNISINWSAI